MSKQLHSSSKSQNKANQSAQNLITSSQETPLSDQSMENYINDKKKLYSAILDFLEEDNESDQEIQFQFIIEVVNDQQITSDAEEMQHFLQIIKNISDNHHRDRDFIKKVIQILQNYKDQIKQTLSNSEIFSIFESNKLIVFYLLKNKIIEISESICNKMLNKQELNGTRYCHFFYTEIESFFGEKRIKDIKNEMLMKDSNIFDNFDNKRQEGENDSFICSLIRQDSVEEFISYVNRTNCSISMQINPSIFETNSFLIEREKTNLIEYAAFFGSIQIFRFLLMNKVQLISSLWLYVIHSKNAELIHLLESNEVRPSIYSDSYIQCFIESIKCHHNDIANYIENTLLEQYEKENNNIIMSYIKYHNYLQFEWIVDSKYHSFFYLCFYSYYKLVSLLLKAHEKKIKNRIIQKEHLNKIYNNKMF